VKRIYCGMSLQQSLHDVTLNSLAFAVNQAHFVKAGLLTLFEIFFDDAGDILRLKGVEINGVLQRNLHRFAEWRIGLEEIRIASLVFAPFIHKKEGKKKVPALSFKLNLTLPS
jgi:hypothetical protein